MAVYNTVHERAAYVDCTHWLKWKDLPLRTIKMTIIHTYIVSVNQLQHSALWVLYQLFWLPFHYLLILYAYILSVIKRINFGCCKMYVNQII